MLQASVPSISQRRAAMGVASALKRFLIAQGNILNLVLLGTYLLFRRTHVDETVDLKAPGMKWGTVHSGKYSTLEIQVATALLATAAFRLYRSPTVDAQLAMVLSFSQVFVLLMTLMTDVLACVHYVVGFGLVFLLFPEEWSSDDSKVQSMNGQIFYESVKGRGESSSTRSSAGVTYVIYLHAPYHARSRHCFPMFAELANRYASDSLCFYKLDVSTWLNVAISAGITELSGASPQLPTVVVFEGGEEKARLPDPKAGKSSLSKLDLIKHLSLDVRYAIAQGSTGSSHSQSTGQQQGPKKDR